jgi:hypothetical protein
MAGRTPTQEPPEYPEEELSPEEQAPDARHLLRMFAPVAAVVVVFTVGLLLVLKFLVVPAMERGDPAVQTRALATIGALQTQEVATRAQQAPTPPPTPQPASTPLPVQAVQPAPQATSTRTSIDSGAGAAATLVTTPAATPPSAETPASAQESPGAPVQLSIDAGNVPSEPNAAAGVVPAPTVDPVAAAEVQQAYAHYWQQRTLALRDLDPSLLTDVAAGDELAALTSRIDDLRAQGRAVQSHVIHHVVALPTAPDEAVIADEYEDLSIFVNFETKAPIDPSNPDPQTGPTVKVRKLLQKFAGVWKVSWGEVYE